MSPTPNSDAPVLLAFGAHPDDIEFGCGGVIARETQAGAKAHFVICSRGESATSGTPEQREEEARRGAAALGASVEFIELGGDARFERRVEHVLKLATLIRRVRPRILLAPTIVENQHPDHAALGHMARDAARIARYGGVKELRDQPAHAIELLLHFAITAEGEPLGESPVLIDVSADPVMQAWRTAMHAHTSQLQTRSYVDLQLTRARLHGIRSGVEHAIALFPSDPLVFDSLRQLGRGARRF